MAEYIDRANLIARIEYYATHTTEGKGEHYAYSVVLNEVLNRPAADVVPVVHGKWIESANFDAGFWVCSKCRFVSEAIAAHKLYGYCPNCGAKMDGGKR